MRSLGNERERKERFQRLFRDYFASMCAFATRYLEDGEEAKDVAHDVFCYLWEHPAELERVEDERTYLYVVTRNKCLDILRRRSARSRYEQSVSSEEKEEPAFFSEEVDREELYRLLDEGIRQLPEQGRKIILLKLEGLKNQEIADRLHVALSTVNTLKNNAYKTLRAFLEKRYRAILLFLTKIKFA